MGNKVEDDDHVINTHQAEGEEEINDNPIEEVRLTVPITDDPTQPALTFRTWVLGLTSCILLAFINKFFGFRQNQLYVSSVAVQIIVLPVGRLMAAALPAWSIGLPFAKNWSFSLNPGPFTLKEHVLITIFASAGAGGVYAAHIITIVKAFYHRGLNIMAAFLLAQTTQLLGYGWAGLFRKYLVDSPYMWWPSNLVQVSLFQTLHEEDKRGKGGVTRLQFFLIVIITSFAYYIVPGYFFPSLSCLSILCWIWKNNITVQQIGSGLHGLGIGSFAFDWNTVAFLGSPLSTPYSAITSIMIGFFIIVYMVLPAAYYTNLYDAKKFPFISPHTFDSSGATYNISRVLDDKTFTFDDTAYEGYSKLYLSVFFALSYGLSFATLTATISHVGLFHGKSIWKLWSQARENLKDEFCDVHSRIMKKNYEQVPQWWFHVLLVCTLGLALLACEGFGKQLQLPWWGLIMACGIAAFFTLPIGIINATTNQQPGLNVITELIIGYLYPGRPLANVSFKTYGYISMSQALWLLQDFKLGHYMKIPPKSMFVVQLVGTIVASAVNFGTTWLLIETVEGICDVSMLPVGSPWTCPGDDVFYNASIIWGVIGPNKIFTKHGVYPGLNWFFLFGFLAPIPVWLLSLRFPGSRWLEFLNMPVLIGASAYMPPARSINYLTWGLVGILFNYYIFKRYKGWWARYNYILSAALDAGIAFMGIVIFFSLQSADIFGADWWGLSTDDYCPLAKCPSAPGIKAKGCPVY
ncbi:oligopeptide transporter, variant 2 [Dionaea muscipula]